MLQALAARATDSPVSRPAKNKTELGDKTTERETPGRAIPYLVSSASSGRIYFLLLSEEATDGLTSFLFFGQGACERQPEVGRLYARSALFLLNV